MRAIRSAESAADGALTPSTPRCPTTNCPRSRRQPPESLKFRPISTITKNPRLWTQARPLAPSRVPPKPRRLSARPESVPPASPRADTEYDAVPDSPSPRASDGAVFPKRRHQWPLIDFRDGYVLHEGPNRYRTRRAKYARP